MLKYFGYVTIIVTYIPTFHRIYYYTSHIQSDRMSNKSIDFNASIPGFSRGVITETLCVSTLLSIGIILTIVAYRLNAIDVKLGSNVIFVIICLFFVCSLILKIKDDKQILNIK